MRISDWSSDVCSSDLWSVDVSVDGNRAIGGIRAGDVINVNQPVASGGFLGAGGTLTEDFLAVSTGATYRADRWTLTGRAEYRDGELANRYGLTLGEIGRAHVRTPVTKQNLVCRLLLEQTKTRN